MVNIGSDNGLSPIRHQSIILTNAGLSQIEPLETNFSENSNKVHFFIQEDAYQNSECEMAAILFRRTWVK